MTTPYYTSPDGEVILHHADALDVLPTLPDASVDAVVCDPPYGLADHHPRVIAEALAAWLAGDRAYVPDGPGGFMGRAWDRFVPPPAVWDECLRVLKPGGHLVAFAAPRTADLMGLSIRLAGFEIRDSLHWIFGCLDDQTEIMIDGEWEPYHKAKKGQHALGYDAERDEFSWQPIQRVVNFPYSDTAYRLVGDHSDQLVTREHRCLVERDGSYVFQEAQEAARECQARVPVLEDVQALLDALPVPDQGSGASQPHLFEGVREPIDGRGADRTAEPTGESAAAMSGLRIDVPTLADQAARGPRTGMFTAVPGGTGRRPPASGCICGAQGVDRNIEGVVPDQDERAREPWVEGRSDLLPQEGQLQGHQVCSMPDGVRIDGPQGRLRNGAPTAGGAGDGQASDATGSCAPLGSRSGEQCPYEPLAIQDEPGPQAVRGSRFTTADLVRIEPEYYDGIAWCVTVPTGAFVARRNGKVFVTGNSGMPKGQNIGKAIDRHRHDRESVLQVTAWLAAARDAAGWTTKRIDDLFGFNGMASHWTAVASKAASVPTLEQWDRLEQELDFDDTEIRPLVAELNGRKGELGEAWARREVIGQGHRVRHESDVMLAPVSTGAYDLTAPATDAARQWHGWNTQLRPAHEPIILARKSTGFDTTVANVLRHGTGALNVDATRTNNPGPHAQRGRKTFDGFSDDRDVYGDGLNAQKSPENPAGRWPTNVLLTHSPLLDADGQVIGDACAEVCAPNCPVAEMDKQSGVLKSGSTKRGTGLTGSPVHGAGRSGWAPDRGFTDSGGASRFFPIFRYEAKAPASERPRLPDGTAWVTVKPLALMQWLVRLITPPGGVVLDWCAGTGTTLQAAVAEGMHTIGIERERDGADLCVIRLARPVALGLFPAS